MIDPTLIALTLGLGCTLFAAVFIYILWDLNR
jgi:hypothetical protein